MLKKLCLVLYLLLISAPVFAVEVQQKVYMEWEFNVPPASTKEVIGFKLYQAGVMVCQWDDPLVRQGECTFMYESGEYDFVLTALYSDGLESPNSIPYKHVLSGSAVPSIKSMQNL